MRLDVDRVAVSGVWLRHVPAGGDPLSLPAGPPSGRWQRGDVVAALYLAEDEPTAWAEWYRALAEQSTPPLRGLPRDLWRYAVDLDDVADLTRPEALRRVGLQPPRPTRRDWPAFQPVGEALWRADCPGVVFASSARPEARALCVFRTGAQRAGVTPLPPPRRQVEPPAPPTGLRT